MISIFNGERRTLGKPSEKDIHAKIDVDFRQYLHHFKGAKLAVFLAIALHINEDGIAFPSYDTLREETGLGRDTIAKALDDLCDTKINGHTVLMKWRERNDKGQILTGNRYKLFPTDEETQSWKKPTVVSTLLEEEPVFKEEPKKKEHIAKDKNLKTERANVQRQQDPMFNAIRDTLGIVNHERIGLIKSIMLGTSANPRYMSCNFETPANAEEVISFGKWYTQKYPRASLPHDPVKIQNHFHAFRQQHKPKSRTHNGRYQEYFEGMGWTDVYGVVNAQ